MKFTSCQYPHHIPLCFSDLYRDLTILLSVEPIVQIQPLSLSSLLCMCAQSFLFNMKQSTHFFLAFPLSLHVKKLPQVISDPSPKSICFLILSLFSLSEAFHTIDHSLIIKILSSLYFYDTGYFGFSLTYLFTSLLFLLQIQSHLFFQETFFKFVPSPSYTYVKTKRHYPSQCLDLSPQQIDSQIKCLYHRPNL